MGIRRRDVLKVAGYSVAGIAGTSVGMRSASADEGSPIVRDVCVIGGGSAGTYAAVRLGDLGKSVVVVERKGRLGGHAETFRDPATGTAVDIGVIVVENIDVVKNYFARFNVPLAPSNFSGGETAYVDYRTGRLVSYAPPAQEQFVTAILTYQQLLAQKFPYLDLGFQLPNQVPEDLLRPFGTFAKKYALEALVPTTFQFGQGLGDLLQDPALYVLKLFSASVVGSILGGGFLSAVGGVDQLYDAAADHLGDDVLFNACVTRVDRSRRDFIRVWVDTDRGPRRIHCRKLVVACPPTLSSLAPLDLDFAETNLFARFRANHYSTGVVRLSGLSPSLSIQNVGADTRYNLPPLPGIYGLSPTGAPGLWNVKYGSPVPLPDLLVRQAIAADIRRMKSARTFPVVFEGFEVFSNHAPFEMMVQPAEIAAGFYRALQGLQGRHDTFYTGAAFQTNDSSLIWRFTESILPQIAA
jgi:hypothetical protein